MKNSFTIWIAVNYYFKSELIFYNIPGNIDEKIMLKVYRDQILEPMAKPWLLKSQNFILEKNSDSRHKKVS